MNTGNIAEFCRVNSLRRCCFTLVELLVIIVIISILAALLLPALSSAKKMSYTSVCQSNMRQIALGMSSYSQDYNYFYPPIFNNYNAASTDAMTYRNTCWMYNIWTHVGYRTENWVYNCLEFGYKANKINIFLCPSNGADKILTSTGASISPNKFSYGLNSSVMGNDVPTPYDKPLDLRLVRQPSSASLVHESRAAIGDYTGYFTPSGWGGCCGILPHNRTGNVLFHDLHVTSLKLAEISHTSTDVFWVGR